MRRRRRANNILPEESERRIAKTMMRRNATTILECSTAWPFRWYHGAFYCSYCDAKYPEVHSLRHHVIGNHSDEQPGKKIFAKLTENNMVKVEVSGLRCRLCRSSFDSLALLKDHVVAGHGKVLHSDYSDGVLPFKMTDDAFCCQICGASFASFARANEHMNSHYQNHVCDTCGKAFVSVPRFRKHVQSHETGSFPCGACGEVCETRAARTFHRMRVHRKGIRYTCPWCREAFTSYHVRAKHLIDFHGQQRKEYVCDVCGRTFDTSSKRSGHQRLVHGRAEKQHECSECSTNFLTKSKLYRHMKSHKT